MKQRLATAKDSARVFRRNMAFAVSSGWTVSKRLFLAKLILYTLQGIFPILVAYLAGRLIDSIVKYLDGSVTSTKQIFIFLIAGTLSSFALGEVRRLARYAERLFSIKYESYITMILMSKFAELDHTYYDDADFHKELNKVNQNLNMILRFGDESFWLISSAVQIVASGIAIMRLSPLITLVLLIGISPLLKVQMKIAKERLQFWDIVDVEWRLRNNIRSVFMDTLTIGEIKIFQLVDYLKQVWQKYYRRTEGVRTNMEKNFQIRQFLAGLVEIVTVLGIDIWLVLKVVAKTGFSLGNFEFYRRVVNDFSNASNQLVFSFQAVTETGLYVRDFLNLMDHQPRVTQSQKVLGINKNIIPKIEFRHVSFKYPGSKKFVLRNLNLTIEPGEDIALVGVNGAGKSTLIKLLMRFYDVTDGQILVDDKNINQIKLSDWYSQVGALFQDFNHYSFFKARRVIGIGNVKEIQNLEKIKAAAKEAGADKFISQLPKKYDSVLTKYFVDGTNLSGGEWQRVALARAFFRNANILILDEPTAAIDAKAEYEIFQKIAKTQAKKTTIIISHRFSTVRNAQKIFVIEHGGIIEQGSHEELMKIDEGTYKHMFELQAEGYR